MEAAEVAKLTHGADVNVCTADGDDVHGKIEAFDKHGLALSMPDNTVSQLAYIPWTTVTGVFLLGGEEE